MLYGKLHGFLTELLFGYGVWSLYFVMNFDKFRDMVKLGIHSSFPDDQVTLGRQSHNCNNVVQISQDYKNKQLNFYYLGNCYWIKNIILLNLNLK